eukprot:Platyproteum_vivax@DN5550_c0_g1_i1.p1
MSSNETIADRTKCNSSANCKTAFSTVCLGSTVDATDNSQSAHSLLGDDCIGEVVSFLNIDSLAAIEIASKGLKQVVEKGVVWQQLLQSYGNMSFYGVLGPKATLMKYWTATAEMRLRGVWSPTGGRDEPRIIICGAPDVGKSTFINALFQGGLESVEGENAEAWINPDPIRTVVISVRKMPCERAKCQKNLVVVEKRHHAQTTFLSGALYSGDCATILVCDVTKPSSLDTCVQCLEEMSYLIGNPRMLAMPKVLVLNKCDLLPKEQYGKGSHLRCVLEKIWKHRFLSQNIRCNLNLSVIETSGLTGQGVDEAVLIAAGQVMSLEGGGDVSCRDFWPKRDSWIRDYWSKSRESEKKEASDPPIESGSTNEDWCMFV